MEKRYQVFVSSTFEDLKEERQAALRAILELDHMPAGMELFPAVDDDAWQLIRDVIDASDYYVVIVGGRYGSLDDAGIGFTEKEYDYALATGKPVIALLHKNPNDLSRGRTDVDEQAWQKLSAFRAKIEKKHTCVFWTSAEELKSRIIISLTATVKRRPAVGWIRADKVPSTDAVREILTLRNRVLELESRVASSDAAPPPDTQGLAQGADVVRMHVWGIARTPNNYHDRKDLEDDIDLSWDEIFAVVAPCMIDEASDHVVQRRIVSYIQQRAREQMAPEAEGRTLGDPSYDPTDVDTCIIQLRALGLIRESDRKRSLKDSGTYWTLTPYGDQRMVTLRALRKGEVSRAKIDDEPESEIVDGAPGG